MARGNALLARIRRSYGAKLALALVAVVVLTVAFGGFVHAQTTAELEDDVRAEMTNTAEIRAAELDTWLSGIERQTRLHSGYPVLRSDDRGEIRDHLSSAVERGQVPDGVVAVHYYDTAEKRILTSSSDELVGVSPAEQGAPFATDPPSFDGADDVYVSSPFRVDAVEFPVVAVISPVEGAENRALVYMINLDSRTTAFSGAAGSESTLVVDGDGRYVSHPDSSMVMGDERVADATLSRVEDGTSFSDDGETVTASATMSSADWSVLVRAPHQEVFGLGSQVASNILGLILLTVVSLGLIGVTIGSNTVISLRQLSRKADAMANGDLSVELETAREDEIGTLFDSFADMRDSLRDQIRSTEAANEHLERKAADYESVMADVADGDLTRRVHAESESEAMHDIGVAFNEMLDELARTVAEGKRFADHVAEAATRLEDGAGAVIDENREVSDSVDEISTGAAKQTTYLHDVYDEIDGLSASAEEVAATVDSVAETSQAAAASGEDGREAARAAVEEMDAVESQTEQTVEEMDALSDEMQAIGDITEVIREIAGQTNLLALNASIEAARTGEDGDGFAVVADEVKNLAEKTEQSAEEIETRLEGVQSRTEVAVEEMRETSGRIESGVETVEDAIEALERIVDRVEQADVSIREIRSATAEQAKSTASVVEVVDEVAGISEQTTAEADSVATAAERQTDTLMDVSEDADALSVRAARLRSVLDDFEVESEEERPSASGRGGKIAGDD